MKIQPDPAGFGTFDKSLGMHRIQQDPRGFQRIRHKPSICTRIRINSARFGKSLQITRRFNRTQPNAGKITKIQYNFTNSAAFSFSRIQQDSGEFNRTRPNPRESPGFARIEKDSAGFSRILKDSAEFGITPEKPARCSRSRHDASGLAEMQQNSERLTRSLQESARFSRSRENSA